MSSTPFRLGLCLPVRPSRGEVDFEHPRRWGCLRGELHRQITAAIGALPNVSVVPVDFRDSVIRDGAVWVNGVDVAEAIDGLFWYCEIDRAPGAFHRDVLHTLARRVPVSPDPTRWGDAVDKFRAHTLLRDAGVPVPECVLVDPHAPFGALEPILERWGAAMLKPRWGAWGHGVMLVEHAAQLRDLLGFVRSRTPDDLRGILLERYHDNDPERRVSVTVVGGQVVYGYKKRAGKRVELGNGRTKVFDPEQRGGDVDLAVLTDEHRRIAVRAAAALDCPILGFDMIETAKGPLVVDENTSPGNYAPLYEEAGTSAADAFASAVGAFIECAKTMP